MSVLEAIYDRRKSALLSKLTKISNDTVLFRSYDSNIKIPNIERLNHYITINNVNYEIYGFNNNKLVDYCLSDELTLTSNYVDIIKSILIKLNLNECDVHVYNTNYRKLSLQNIIRFENRKRSRNEFESDPTFKSIFDQKFNYNIDNEWISASKTRNSALNDRCLDYYDEYNISKYDDEPNKSKRVKRELGEFVEQKFNEGIIFEGKVYEFLKQKYNDDIIKICESYMARDKNMCIKTFKAMYKGYPIIYQGVLQNPENKTLGSVDLLVRDDYINDISNNPVPVEKLKSIFPHRHFYYAVDIKNSKLHFNVDNTTLRNNTNVKPFKYQLHVYNEALKYMQNIKTSKAFILGNGWKMEKIVNKEKIKDGSYQFNDKLGIIDFSSKDDFIVNESEDAIQWMKALKSSTDWTHKPPSNINIFPNMCNTYDDGYRHIKQKSAEELKDITLISYLTPQHREKAFKCGIKTWDDSRLKASILGVNGKTGELVDAILNTNRDKTNKTIFYKTLNNTIIDQSFPQLSNENIFDSSKLAYFIDFETIINNNYNYVYMIGLGYVFNDIWHYKCFTLDRLDSQSETKMYDELLKYIDEINKKHNINYQPMYYHWTSVEPYQLNKMVTHLKLPQNNIKWFDLYKYFKENIITIKGAFGHSLKTVGKALYQHKLIQTYWDKNILSDNKIHIYAYEKYVKNIPNNFNQLINYNEVDCKIMFDILKVIRKLK
jgi:hypothetical protein